MRGLKSALVIFAFFTLALARQRPSKPGKEASSSGTDREGKSMFGLFSFLLHMLLLQKLRKNHELNSKLTLYFYFSLLFVYHCQFQE